MGYKFVCSPDTEKYTLPYVEDEKGNRFTWKPLYDMNQAHFSSKHLAYRGSAVLSALPWRNGQINADCFSAFFTASHLPSSCRSGEPTITQGR